MQLRLFPAVLLFSCAAWPCAAWTRPFDDLQLHWYFKQSWDCGEVCDEPPLCTQEQASCTTGILLQTIFFEHSSCWQVQTHTHTYTVYYGDDHIQQFSDQRDLIILLLCCIALLKLPVEAFQSPALCLFQHTVSFVWRHLNQDTFDSHPLTERSKCLFREPFDCINQKWESVSDWSWVYSLILLRWRHLTDHQPL